jgi:hypothetical protein
MGGGNGGGKGAIKIKIKKLEKYLSLSAVLYFLGILSYGVTYRLIVYTSSQITESWDGYLGQL